MVSLQPNKTSIQTSTSCDCQRARVDAEPRSEVGPGIQKDRITGVSESTG
jgi:hypothetical protein